MKLTDILFILLLIPISSAITIDNPSQTFEFTNVTLNFSSNQTYDNIQLDSNQIILSNYLFQIIPTSPLNVTINTYNNTGDYYKSITLSSSISSNPTTLTIGNFPANTVIQIKKNGANWNTYTSNSTGYITFTYSESFSDVLLETNLYTSSTGSSGGSSSGKSKTLPQSEPSYPILTDISNIIEDILDTNSNTSVKTIAILLIISMSAFILLKIKKRK